MTTLSKQVTNRRTGNTYEVNMDEANTVTVHKVTPQGLELITTFDNGLPRTFHDLVDQFKTLPDQEGWYK